MWGGKCSGWNQCMLDILYTMLDCITLHVTLCYTTLHCVMLHYIMLHYITGTGVGNN